jgi:hypothetical protein
VPQSFCFYVLPSESQCLHGRIATITNGEVTEGIVSTVATMIITIGAMLKGRAGLMDGTTDMDITASARYAAKLALVFPGQGWC